jgi:glutathione synthase/RimK-type ligase-like ATP-grasp enzyme
LTVHPELRDPDGQQFAFVEAHNAVAGMWLTLDAFWINPPSRDEAAARKVYQLKAASESGFRVPETCVTNNPEHAREFIERRGSDHTVYKAFSGTMRAWRETRLLRSSELDLLANVKYAPVIFQEYIPAKVDLRITVVGERIFPASIYSQETDYKVDFRMTMDQARVEATELPPNVSGMLRALMSKLGLVYGAIDMRLTPDDEYVFLELNPAGQWLFIEQRTRQPITEAMAELMVTRDDLKTD